MTVRKTIVLPLTMFFGANLCVLSASAQFIGAEADRPSVRAGGFLGAGIGFAPDYEGSEDIEAVPAVFGAYKWDNGRFIKLGGSNSAGRAASLRVNMVSTSMSSVWQLGPVAQFRPERDDVDNDSVDRLNDVDSALELGVFGGFASGRWSANLTFAADVSDEHEGFVITFDGDYDMPVNDQLTLALGVAATYADEEYMETYFGVNPRDSARSGLRVFDADNGVKDVGVSLTARYRVTGAWGLLGSLSYFRLLDDAADSPLVDDEGSENQLSGVIAATYSF